MAVPDSRASADDSIEIRRHLEALRRSRWIMLAIVVAFTGVVLVASLVASPQYEATTRILVDPSLGGLTTDDSALQRELATTESLATTTAVLRDAAASLPNTSVQQLTDDVTSSVDPDANVISITARSGNAREAAAIANAVSRSFLDQQRQADVARLDDARRSLTRQVEQLQGQPDPNGDIRQEVRALQERIAEISVSAASAGSGLQIAEAASVPDAPVSPRPLRNAILAIFASLILAVLVALIRDQISPRVTSQRALGQLLDLPVLGAIPHTPSRMRKRGLTTAAEQEAYQSLAASLRLALPPDRQHVVLVTSAMPAEGKTAVASSVAPLLAQAGHDTVLVSGDLRRPRLDHLLSVSGELGFTDLLTEARNGHLDPADVKRGLKPRRTRDRHAGQLSLLPSGTGVEDFSAVLNSEAIGTVFEALRATDATYIVVDAPPLLGVADAQLLGAHADELLVVSRLNWLGLNTAADLGDALNRIAAHPLGLVVVGGRSEASPYYVGMRSRPSDTVPAFD